MDRPTSAKKIAVLALSSHWGGCNAFVNTFLNNVASRQQCIFYVWVFNKTSLNSGLSQYSNIRVKVYPFKNKLFSRLYILFLYFIDRDYRDCSFSLINDALSPFSNKPSYYFNHNDLVFTNLTKVGYSFPSDFSKFTHAIVGRTAFLWHLLFSRKIVFFSSASLFRAKQFILSSLLPNILVTKLSNSHLISFQPLHFDFSNIIKRNYSCSLPFPKACNDHQKPFLDLVYISTLAPYKNHRYLMHTSSLLTRAQIPHKFSFFGPFDGAFSDTLINQIKKYPSCTYCGFLTRDQLTDLYLDKNKAFVSSSLVESFGHFILEPMAFHRPCFVPETPEALELCCKTAYFYDHCNPDALYKSILNYYHLLLQNSFYSVQNNLLFDKWIRNYMSDTHSFSLLNNVIADV